MVPEPLRGTHEIAACQDIDLTFSRPILHEAIRDRGTGPSITFSDDHLECPLGTFAVAEYNDCEAASGWWLRLVGHDATQVIVSRHGNRLVAVIDLDDSRKVSYFFTIG